MRRRTGVAGSASRLGRRRSRACGQHNSTGSAGATGNDPGSAGATNTTGSAGATSSSGSAGNSGAAGTTGDSGSAGNTSSTGSAGAGATTGTAGSTGTGASSSSAGSTGSAGAAGNSGSAALLTISDGPTSFSFGTLATNSSSNHLFFVTNNGALNATSMTASLTAPFAFVGGAYPGTGGSCGPSLAPGASCVLNIAFTPSAAVTASELLDILYFDGAHAADATRQLTGTGTAHAFLAITDFPVVYYQQYGLHADPPTFAFGAHGTGSTTLHTFAVTNNGAVDATGMSGDTLAPPYAFGGGSYPGLGGTCGATLAPGGSCMLVVTFTPTAVAGSIATLGITYNDGGGTNHANRPMSGNGASGPVLVVQDFDVTNLQPGGWDFGARGIGNADTHQFYVLNTGGATATSMTGPFIGNGFGYVGGSYPGSGGTCSATLAAGASCFVNVAFQPTSPGPTTGAVKIDYRDSTATQLSASRVVTGVGTTLGLLQITQSKDDGGGLLIDFGTAPLGAAAEQPLMVRNLGGGSASNMAFASLAAPFAFAGGVYPGTGGDCGTSLAAGASCTIVVDFTPAGVGTFAGTLSVTYNDGGSTQSTSHGLIGQGVDGAALAVTAYSSGGGGDSSFDYGPWGVPVDHTFYVANRGNKAASAMTGLAPGGQFSWKGGAYPGAGGTCAATLAVNSSCTLVVTFSGAATDSANVGVSYADGTGNTKQGTLEVTGEAAPNAIIVVSDCNECGGNERPADFGTTSGSVMRSFVVRNTGAKTATMLRDSGMLGAPFAYAGGSYPGTSGNSGDNGSGNCSGTLDPGATCSVYVTFTPHAAGAYAGMLGLAYDDGTGTGAQATRALIGAETNLALLHIHDWSESDNGGPDVYDLGTTGVAVDHTFTITNDGGRAATLISDGNGLGGGFGWKDGSYPGSGGDCGTTLAIGAHCRLVVTFTPSGNGYHSSMLLVGYYDGSTAQYVKRAISATASTAAQLQITDGDQPFSNPQGPNPPPFDYGTIGTSSTATFTVTNWGGSTATGLGDGGTLANGFAWAGGVVFGGGTCGAQLAAGASCTVKVTFSSSGNGLRSSALSVTYNDGTAAQAATRAINATATTKAVINVYDWYNPQGNSPPGSQSWNPPPYDYGVWGVPVEHQFTLRNDGGGAASVMADGGSLGTGFAWKDGHYPGTGGTCGTSLAVGATCIVVVTFTPPAAPGTRFGQLKVSYFDGATTQTVVRSISATATANANLTVSEYFGAFFCSGCSPYDLGSYPLGGSVEHTFTITNTGAITAVNIAPTAELTAPFSYKGSAGYPGTGGDCGATLAAGASCSLFVVFHPQTVGQAMSTLGVTYSDSTSLAGNASRSIQAIATSP